MKYLLLKLRTFYNLKQKVYNFKQKTNLLKKLTYPL